MFFCGYYSHFYKLLWITLLFSGAEFGKNFIYQIFSHSFPDNASKGFISVHQIYGKEILRHLHLNTVFTISRLFLASSKAALWRTLVM